MPGEQPNTDFQNMMERLRCRDEQAWRYYGATTQPRRWMLPPPRGWDGDLHNISGINQAFDRVDLNEEAKDNTDNGTTGIGAGKGLQIGIMGALERAFRLRHMNICRAQAHVAGRKKAHANQDGIHTGDTVTFVQDMLDSGGHGS